jgi:opacity protein-like surface antigen
VFIQLPGGIMRISRVHTFLVFLCAAVFGGVAASAQTDIAASVYGAFTGTTNGNGTTQSPSNAAGTLIEVRHIDNPLIGYEVTYSYNRANEVYRTNSFACPGALPCLPPTPAPVSANAHEVAADWVVSGRLVHLKPFALAGVGLLLDIPSGNQSFTNTEVKPVFVYGAGLDWALVPHLGLRFQYRGNLYEAPDLTKLYTSTSAFTHTAEPMIGAYLRF